MASAEIVTTPAVTEVRVVEPEKREIVLRLSEEEARFLIYLTGRTYGHNGPGAPATSIYASLRVLGRYGVVRIPSDASGYVYIAPVPPDFFNFDSE